MEKMLNVLDLFSGIGGFSYGLKQAGGFRTVAYCEIEEYAQEVLLRRMQDGQLDPAPIHTDITRLDGRPLRGHVDLICGGFPCQDLSVAGKQAGIDGERSGLWGEYARLIREIRPRYVLVENVPNLLVLGMHRVLGDLAASGYDAEWSCISAAEMGAPHKRDRVWIIGELADSDGTGCTSTGTGQPKESPGTISQPGEDVADSERTGLEGRTRKGLSREGGASIELAGGSFQEKNVAHSGSGRQPGQGQSGDASNKETGRTGKAVKPLNGSLRPVWCAEPNVGRVANGIPSRVDRLKSLGNAIVPQIATYLGERILQSSPQ